MLKIQNETKYLTRDLKKMSNLVLKNFFKNNKYKRHLIEENLTIEVKNGRRTITGGAQKNGNKISKIILALPKNVQEIQRSEKLRAIGSKIGLLDDDTANFQSATMSFEEEIASYLTRILLTVDSFQKVPETVDVSFVPKDFQIIERNTEPKKKTDHDKLHDLYKRKKAWTSKMKRCENAIDKIEKKIKYYKKKGL